MVLLLALKLYDVVATEACTSVYMMLIAVATTLALPGIWQTLPLAPSQEGCQLYLVMRQSNVCKDQE